MSSASINPNGGSGNEDGRGSWCTPRWLADLIGRKRLDPCGNPRSHVEADHIVSLEMGGNGLYGEGRLNYGPGWYLHENHVLHADEFTETFINPPYGRGEVSRWVRHYRHTDFTYLLRFDPSTEWFGELIPFCNFVWFPIGRRIEFEPPPGVKASKNPFPHALYLREEPNEALKRAGYTFETHRGWIDMSLEAMHSAA